MTDYAKITPALEAMAHYKLPLLVHGEVTDPKIDIFDRERVFVETRLPELLVRCGTSLKVVLEHMTTKEAVDFVMSGTHQNVGATITPQHLLANRNHMLAGGIRPHFYCLPILKTEEDRQALLGRRRLRLRARLLRHRLGAARTSQQGVGLRMRGASSQRTRPSSSMRRPLRRRARWTSSPPLRGAMARRSTV